MAGIYIHIPFCKTRCIYCDFYSTTRSELKQPYIRALCAELKARKDYLKEEPIETIYFGGGTPSQLAHEDFEQIFRTIKEVYGTEHAEEITLEANPDDLTEEYVAMLRTLPFNRISMGIQTFDDPTLKLLNRRHDAAQAIAAVHRLRQAGFRNISIDLIYGLPGETDRRWERDLQQAVSLDVEHISAYHLTYEEGTRIYEMLQSHRISEVDEESSVRFFSVLMDTLEAAGYEHYEISNFCKPGMHSRHNTSYWKGIPYLGICLGMQIAVMEFARHVAGITDANSGEFDELCANKVIDYMPGQNDDIDKGGTLRLGSYPCEIQKGTGMEKCYGTNHINERHRHRYEFNNAYRDSLQQAGLTLSGLSPDGRLVEAVELSGHPFFIGVQYHPEFKSRPNKSHPLFQGFVNAACEHVLKTGN